MTTRRDDGLVSAFVVCLVLPWMASMWWRYSLDPSLHAASDQRSSYAQAEGKLDADVPVSPQPKKLSKRQRVVEKASLVVSAGTFEVPDSLVHDDRVPDELRSLDPLVFTQDDVSGEVR